MPCVWGAAQKVDAAEITPIEPEPGNAGVGNHRCFGLPRL